MDIFVRVVYIHNFIYNYEHLCSVHSTLQFILIIIRNFLNIQKTKHYNKYLNIQHYTVTFTMFHLSVPFIIFSAVIYIKSQTLGYI